MKHSKGKWQIKNLGNKNEWTEIFVVDDDGVEYSICKIYAGLYLGEEKANAKLILVAPENLRENVLNLVFLKGILDYYESKHSEKNKLKIFISTIKQRMKATEQAIINATP